MNRLKELRQKKGYSQQDLANLLFVNQTAVSQWERGVTTPSPNIQLRLCELFETSLDYLMGREPLNQPTPTGIKIPVLGYVRAGVPLEAVEDILDYEEIPAELAAQGEFFALKIKGDSMQPRIMEGDVVIVRKQPDVDSGDIAVVLVNGSDATIKKLVKYKNGINLIAFNPAYDPTFYSFDEIASLPVSVVGKVIELRGKF